MNIKIVPATIEDAEALAAVQQKAFKRLYDIYQDEGKPFFTWLD